MQLHEVISKCARSDVRTLNLAGRETVGFGSRLEDANDLLLKISDRKARAVTQYYFQPLNCGNITSMKHTVLDLMTNHEVMHEFGDVEDDRIFDVISDFVDSIMKSMIKQRTELECKTEYWHVIHSRVSSLLTDGLSAMMREDE